MTADTIGGVWTYALELTLALQAFGVEVHMATMGKKLNQSQWKEADTLHNLKIYESDYALEWMDNPWQDVESAGRWLLSLAREIQPDLIHLNNYIHGALSWPAPVLMVGHSCVLSWWEAVKKERAPAYWHTYADLVKKGLQHANAVVGISQTMLNCLHRHYGPISYAKVIYNGREKKGFTPETKAPVIYSMGRLWDEAKNIHALQCIAGQLSWPVYVAGDDQGKLQAATNNFHLLGKLSMPEVKQWLSKAGIYVMPARYEPFGLSLLEAALSGCALVAGDIPSLRELWEGAALFADPENPQALCQQIEKLIQQPELRQNLAVAAMKRAEKFSLQQMGVQYMDVYRQLFRVPSKAISI